MTKEDYIAELAGGLDCAGIPGDYDPSVLVDNIAEQVINAGYRKAEDVRRETIRELCKWLSFWLEWDEEGVVRAIAERYGVEVE